MKSSKLILLSKFLAIADSITEERGQTIKEVRCDVIVLTKFKAKFILKHLSCLIKVVVLEKIKKDIVLHFKSIAISEKFSLS